MSERETVNKLREEVVRLKKELQVQQEVVDELVARPYKKAKKTKNSKLGEHGALFPVPKPCFHLFAMTLSTAHSLVAISSCI